MKNIKALGIDLAKNVFQIHGTDAKGKCVLRKRVSRTKLIEFVANLPPCIIGIEACGGSHYWARLFKQYGHEVRMMSPQFVKPYVKSNKNDRNDSEAIAEACTRPTMRFVPIKTIAQQDILVIHRARELSIKNRTAQASQIRGILNEYGITVPQGISKIRRLIEIVELNKDKLSLWVANKKQRCGYNKVAVALANKNARMVWAIMATGECYRQPRMVA